MKTSGPVRLWRENQSVRIASPTRKSTAANAANAASIIYGTSESTVDRRRIVSAPARDGIAQTT